MLDMRLQDCLASDSLFFHQNQASKVTKAKQNSFFTTKPTRNSCLRMATAEPVRPQDVGDGNDKKKFETCKDLYEALAELELEIGELQAAINNLKNRPRGNLWRLRSLKRRKKNYEKERDDLKKEMVECNKLAKQLGWKFSVRKAMYETPQQVQEEFSDLVNVSEDLEPVGEGLPPVGYLPPVHDTQCDIATDL